MKFLYSTNTELGAIVKIRSVPTLEPPDKLADQADQFT